MQKVLALSTLQSLVNDHSGMIYHEALDCIKKELAEALKPSHNNARDEICPHCTNGRNLLIDSLGSINSICPACHGTGKLSPVA